MFQLETTAKVVANNPENAWNQKDGPSLIHGLGVTAWEISRGLQPQGVGPPARSSLASGAAAVRPDHGKRWEMARQTSAPVRNLNTGLQYGCAAIFPVRHT